MALGAPVVTPAPRMALGPSHPWLHPPARTAVVHAAPPAPQQDAPCGAHAGIVAQGSADVEERLFIVAGLVHAPLQVERTC